MRNQQIIFIEILFVYFYFFKILKRLLESNKLARSLNESNIFCTFNFFYLHNSIGVISAEYYMILKF